MTKTEQLLHYWKLAQLPKTFNAKVAFFNENEQAFLLDSQEGEDFENCKHSFCSEKGLDKEETEEFQDNSWESFPNDFKAYAFDYCILEGVAYEDVECTLDVAQITSLISVEKLFEKLEDEGISPSEAEDDVMLLLERRLKKAGKSATEDDLYDATQNLLSDLIDWMDDHHPDNIEAA
ncbi:hypothetical protein [Prochlorococcus sp. MIT 1307]|uniref:hypothetical protein n=1 Tax=Prochlorococcus sp. MIT 1307 TaxID=3096219 RepID=UPI002A752A9E|nr:hypothetical protein [Prochlorococcus sp. MIT 1307]